MPSRRLLMITYHFPPSAAVAVHRMLGMTRYLPEHGWHTTVVAPPGLPWEPTDPALMSRIPAETTVVHVPFRSGGLWNKVQARFRPFRRWIADALRACERVIAEQQPNAVYTTSPPGCVHELGLNLHRRFGLPWMACLRDPWIVNRRPEEIPRWLRCLENPQEARVMRSADCIVANTPRNLDGLSAAYPDQAQKMVAILNGFEAENFPRELPAPTPRNALTLLHAGELYYGRDPRPLFDALRDLRGSRPDPEIRMQFLGRSTEGLFDLVHESRARGIEDRVTVESQVPYAESLQRMLQADILVLIHSPGFRIGVPAKLYEYLGARKPVLAIAEPDGDIAAVLRASGLPHRIAPLRAPDQIRQALAELTQLVASGQWTRPTLDSLQPFTRAAMGEKIARCLDRIVGANQTSKAPALASAM